MRSNRWRVHWIVTLLLACAGAAASTQDEPAEKSYQPVVGQAGKDVIWVPTAETLVEKMLDVARVQPHDFVIDLGSGDGRTVIAAARRGARALGIEYNPEMVELSKRNAKMAGIADRVEFVEGDIFASDFSRATVITMFLLTEINLKLRQKLLDLRPGTRIVSNTFGMGGWSADQIVVAEDNCQHYCVAHYWVVPAKIAGRWRSSRGELDLKQSFQIISGTITTESEVLDIVNGKLEGVRISFSAGGTQFLGYVNGNRIEGIAHGPDGSVDWIASALKPR